MNTETDQLANEILNLSRNKLLVTMRFMNVALSYHKRIAYEGSLATDGQALFYNPGFVLKTYKKSQEEMVRLYLHMILHCVFHHPFIGMTIDERLWNLACDIAVECTISDLGIKSVSSDRERKQKDFIDKVEKDLKTLTAEKIYSYLKRADYPDWDLEYWERAFRADNHEPWYRRSAEDSLQSLIENSKNDISKFWKQISEQIQTDLEFFSKQHGNGSGSMMQNLRAVHREKYNYTSFLKKFAVLGETMQINEDEFDYIYYTYGLEHYSNMPLIEPLEYKDAKRIREFVIAIDSSGSVMGEEVQLFLQKTYNILMQENSYFSRVNIHIIQCDADIQ